MPARATLATLATALVLLTAALALALAPAAASAAPGQPPTKPKVSYTQMLNEFMCLECHESLAVAQSSESYSERQYLRTLIAQGDTRKQIEQAMVQAYGPGVLATPPAHGFNVVAYVLPPVLVVLAIAGLALTIPKWRRRGRQIAAETAQPPTAPLTSADAERLAADLARHP